MPKKGGLTHIRFPFISLTMLTKEGFAKVRKEDINSAKQDIGFDGPGTKVIFAPNTNNALDIGLDLIINLSRQHPSGPENLELCNASVAKLKNFDAGHGEMFFPGQEKRNHVSVSVTAEDPSQALNCLMVRIHSGEDGAFEAMMFNFSKKLVTPYICARSADKKSFAWFGVGYEGDTETEDCSDEIAERDGSVGRKVANMVLIRILEH